MANIAIIKPGSSRVTGSDLKIMAIGQTKYARLVTNAYGLKPIEVYFAPNGPRNKNDFVIDIQENLSAPGILGEHQLIDNRVVITISASATIPDPIVSPFGIILDSPNGDPFLWPGSMSEVISHEIAESLLNQWANCFRYDQVNNQLVFMEICDIADAYRFPITVRTGILGSKQQMICQDFGLPAAWDNQATSGPYSHTGQLSGPFKLDKNCYRFVMPAGAWTPQGIDRIGGQR